MSDIETETQAGQPSNGAGADLIADTGKDQELAEHAALIRRFSKRVIGDVIEIGRRLAEVKKIVGHGNFLPWIEREFGWSEDTAERLIAVHAMQRQIPQVRDLVLPISALYLLAASSTPAEARTEIVQRAEAGEAVTVADVKEAIKARRLPTRQQAIARAKEIGGFVAARDGYVYSGASEEERKEAKAQRTLDYAVVDAVKTLATLELTPPQFLDRAAQHHLWKPEDDHQIVQAFNWLFSLRHFYPRPLSFDAPSLSDAALGEFLEQMGDRFSAALQHAPRLRAELERRGLKVGTPPPDDTPTDPGPAPDGVPEEKAAGETPAQAGTVSTVEEATAPAPAPSPSPTPPTLLSWEEDALPGFYTAWTAGGGHYAVRPYLIVGKQGTAGYSASYYRPDANGDREIKVDGKRIKLALEEIARARTADKAKAAAQKHYDACASAAASALAPPTWPRVRTTYVFQSPDDPSWREFSDAELEARKRSAERYCKRFPHHSEGLERARKHIEDVQELLDIRQRAKCTVAAGSAAVH